MISEADERELLFRIDDWLLSDPRKPAGVAFTAGIDRQIAYRIEGAEQHVKSDIAAARREGAREAIDGLIASHERFRSMWEKLREGFAERRDSESIVVADNEIQYHSGQIGFLKIRRRKYAEPEEPK